CNGSLYQNRRYGYICGTDVLISKSWVFDTGSVAHICNSIQGLQSVRKLARNKVQIRVGNGVQIIVRAVGIMTLCLPSGFTLELNNCYFVPALCKNVISGSCLLRDGYSFKSRTMVVHFLIIICFMDLHPLRMGCS